MAKELTAPVPTAASPARSLTMPLTLSGNSAKEGAVLARSRDHPEVNHAPVGRREVVCFDCQTVGKASAKAASTQCSNCGTFIDLRDIEIRERTTQRIRTRGNVTIHKKGILLGTAIHCGSLIVEGAVSGSIYAQETVEFRTDGKVLGEIRCRHLVIERKVQVSGLQPVHVTTAEIDGSLSARVFATGLVRISRQGRLDGGLMAAGLALEQGGELVGPMRIGGRG
jgi:cytoskeletal protein CcmA (bactofilin family)